jgi:alginate O-acetyltransferase complex protein AlgF
MTLHSTRRRSGLSALLLSLLACSAVADEAALYGPSAPKGSAFVRAFNADTVDVDVTIGSLSLNDIGVHDSSEFRFLPAGSYSASTGTKSLPVKLNSDQYYTLVQLPGGQLQLLDEPPFAGKQKALLRLQNLSDAPLTLKTADGKTDVIAAVAGKASGEREINPLKVRLALFSGATKVSDLEPLVLERGELVCLYVTGSGGKLVSTWVKRTQADD